MQPKIVRPDSKGRITLGVKFTNGISGFIVTETNDHRLILEPCVEITKHEQWLFANKLAMQQVQNGLKDAQDGRLVSKGSFSHFADDDID